MITTAITVAGKLAADPVLSETKKGKPMAKILIEATTARQVKPGDIQEEKYIIPITVFSYLVGDIEDLRQGARLLVVGHLNGTVYTPQDGAPSHGLQLIADAVTFPPATAKETR
jgi:single-stranded DNA-binding protein